MQCNERCPIQFFYVFEIFNYSVFLIDKILPALVVAQGKSIYGPWSDERLSAFEFNGKALRIFQRTS